MLFNLLCLSTSYADCIAETGQSCRQSASLPQHVLRGLHPLNRREYQAFRLFASARPTRIASCDKVSLCIFSTLCLSTSYADCISPADGAGDIQQPFASARPTRIASRGVLLFRASGVSLPQHVLRGLHHGAQIGSSGSYAFASARPTRIASDLKVAKWTIPDFASARPTRIASRGVLLFRASGVSLPQHVLRGLHPVCPRGTCATAPFASARPTRIASFDSWIAVIRPLLCLSTSYADCIHGGRKRDGHARTLPQHVLRGLHRFCSIRCICIFILCLSTSYADCITRPESKQSRVITLPQHVLRGLHRQKRTR